MIDQLTPPAIQMVGISKEFAGTRAVSGVDFEARAGEVHALMGENGAGKSTLMKILAGSFSDYTGDILVRGEKVLLHSPARAKAAGIAMIYQELSLTPSVSIAENILAGRLPSRGFILDRKALRTEAARWLERVGLSYDPDTPAEALSQHERQLVEIAKALSNHPSVLVFDEPTSALSRHEVEILFGIIRDLKAEGLAIIYISHYLPEVFAVSDRCTVMRDGRKVNTSPMEELTPEGLVEMMIGRSAAGAAIHRKHAPGEVRLSVREFSRYGFFHNVGFDVRAAEILGIGGLAGAGRSELARSLVGIDPSDDGEITLDGMPLVPTSLRESMRRGLAYLTEDRKLEGLALLNSAEENTLSALNARRSMLIPEREGREIFERLSAALQLSPPEPERQAAQFSGGNQQKVLLAKWLAIDPDVIILDEPTRGVDVGAKQVIHEAIGKLADSGKCVILISSDLPELVSLSNRIVILRKGHLTREMPKSELTEEAVLLAANAES